MVAESINTISWNWADPSNPVAVSEADSITDATVNTNLDLPDGHLGGNGNWLYGIHASNLDVPIEQLKWKPIYYGDPDPAELVVIHSDVTVGHGFQPVNGLMWYKFLGNSTKSGSIHQVRGNARGATLPVWVSRAEMSGGSADINLSAVGCKMGAITQTFHMNGAFSTGTTEIASIRSQNGAIAANGLAGTPKLPSGIGNTYRASLTANDVFSWNGNDLKTTLNSIQFNGINNLQRTKIANQAELEFQTETTRAIMISFQYIRGLDSNSYIYNDFRDRNQRTLIFGQSQTATNYIKFTCYNVSIAEHKAVFLSQQNESATLDRIFDVKAICTSMDVDVDDGVSDAFYGD